VGLLSKANANPPGSDDQPPKGRAMHHVASAAFPQETAELADYIVPEKNVLFPLFEPAT
jgi:hypothetical protein